jgi:hypothetical protein
MIKCHSLFISIFHSGFLARFVMPIFMIISATLQYPLEQDPFEQTMAPDGLVKKRTLKGSQLKKLEKTFLPRLELNGSEKKDTLSLHLFNFSSLL